MATTKTSAIITSVNPVTNKAVSKAITDINPAANNDAIKALCESLNGLTNNTFSSAMRVDKTDITEGGSGGSIVSDKPKVEFIPNQEVLDFLEFGSDTEDGIENVTHTNTTVPFADLGKMYARYSWVNGNNELVADFTKTAYVATTCQEGMIRIMGSFKPAAEKGYTGLVVDYHFPETDTSAATDFRLSIISGQATTFEQL